MRAALENRHFDAETAKHLSELESDVSAANNQHRSREDRHLDPFVAREKVTRQERHVDQTIDHRNSRTRASGDEDAIAGRAPAVDCDGNRIDELHVSAGDLDVITEDRLVLFLSVTVDNFVFLSDELCEVED